MRYKIHNNPRFHPQRISGLYRWLDADDKGTITVDYVSEYSSVCQWDDKSGNANHYTEPCSSMQPIIIRKVQNDSDMIEFPDSSFIESIKGAHIFIIHIGNLVGEIVAYNEVLADDDVTALKKYFFDRWGMDVIEKKAKLNHNQ